MSALLDSLLTRQQRADVALNDGLNLPGQDSRVERLIAALADERAKNDALAHRVADLSAELRTLKGDDAQPQPGCLIVSVPYLMGRLLIEVETEGEDDGIDVCNVYVNGRWLDPEDAAAELDLDRLRERAADVLREEA